MFDSIPKKNFKLIKIQVYITILSFISWLQWWYYPHRSRDSVSPVCGIFQHRLNMVKNFSKIMFFLRSCFWYISKCVVFLQGFKFFCWFKFFVVFWLKRNPRNPKCAPIFGSTWTLDQKISVRKVGKRFRCG